MKNVKKLIFLLLGTIFTIVGIIGIILPIIPGIPFLLAAILFFAKGSGTFTRRLIKNEFTGKYIRTIRKEGISKKIKMFTLFFTWITHIVSIIFIKNSTIKITLLFTLVSVTWIMLSLKSKNKSAPKKSLIIEEII